MNTQRNLIFSLCFFSLFSCGQQNSSTKSPTAASQTATPQNQEDSDITTPECQEVLDSQYDGEDQNGLPVLSKDSTLLAQAYFDGGYTEPEETFFRQCLVLAEGKTILFDVRGEKVNCKISTLKASVVNELKTLRDEVEQTPEVRSEYGLCDAPSYGISLRDQASSQDTFPMEQNQDCGDRITRPSPSAEVLRQKLMAICESSSQYQEWGQASSQYSRD